MADDSNPFADAFSGSQDAPASAPTVDADNPFADAFQPPPEEPSAFGAGFHSFERGIIPALTSIPGMGAGAEVGAGIGAFGGPAAPVTVPVGAVLGGLTGALLSSWAASSAQDYALKQLPEKWQDALGQSASQQQAEEEKQPVASFIGGLVPYALTMRPSFSMAKAVLPENATAIQRLMANPLTAHLFGGAVTGGMELGSEAANKESPNWTKIGIATAFGTVFNTPTKIGEALTEVGARPARQLLGRPEPVPPVVAPETPPPSTEAPAAPVVPKPADVTAKEWNETLLGQKPGDVPTVAQAGDAKVLGPGIDEAVFMGAHEQAPEALMAAQDTARTEASILRPEESTPSVNTVARRMEPDLFGQYEGLQAQLADLTAHPDQAGVQQHITATQSQINEIAPQVAAAYRRAADVVQSPTVEPPAPEPVQPTQPAPNGQVPTAAPSTLPSRETLDAEQASIAQQVTANLIAAGRSPEEAAAGGQLLGHYYRTRSAKFKGALGSPMELFNQQGPTIRRYGASVAPLMPTEARPTIAPEKAPTNVPQNIPQNIPEPVKPLPEQQVAELRNSQVSGTLASEIEAIDPANIGVDAGRFQFKAGGDEQGVSDRLQGVEKWDPRLAGTALIFRDTEGKNWVADGHQRIGLAKRLMEAGHPPIKVNAFVLDAKDGLTDSDARVIAGIKNIGEGTGTAIDAAKILREAKEKTGVDLPKLPPRSALFRDGTALAELSPEAFGIAVNEVVPFQQAAVVGRLVKNPAQQVEALRLLEQIKPDNLTQAEMVVRDMLSSGTEMTTQGTLFGDEAFASSIVRERAKIADEALKLLRRDKQTFKTLVDEAERIQGAGANVLDQTANQGRLSTDEQAAEFLKQLAFRAGPVSDALSAVARKLKVGEIKPGEAARSFLDSVRGAVESGLSEGADAGGAVSGAAGERPVDEGPTFFQSRKPEPWRPGDMFGGFETERGLEGLPQTLIPGVKPLTDAERIAAEAAKPLKGGAAPPKAGSLFDVEGREDSAAQRELFQPAYHGSPHIFDKFSTEHIGRGEGAQAYGHGLYFASEKAIAQHYRNALAGAPRQVVLFDGKPVKSYRNITNALDTAAKENPKHYDGAVRAFIEVASDAIRDGDKPKFDHLLRDRVSDIMSRVDNLRKRAAADEETPPLASTYSPSQLRERADVEEARANAIKDAAARVTFEGKKQAGRLYHVEVPDEHELMDWDKRLGDQPEYVKEKLKGLGFVDEKPIRTTVGGLPVPEWMWSISNDGKVPPQTGISDLIKPMQDAIAAHPDDANKAADRFLEEMKSPAFGTKGPLVEARLKAADVIAAELRSASLRHGPAEAPALDELIPNDPALHSVLADIAKVEPDPQNWSMAVRDHPDLENKVWAWARTNPDATAGLQHPTAGTIIDGVLGNYFYHQSLYNDFLRESGHGLTGKEIYEKLSHESGPAGASEKLREAGIPGHQYIGHESQKTNYVIYDDSRLAITNYEQQKRGAIQFAPGRKPIIKLFADADASTFFHESSHQWLEDLLRDAVHPSAPGALKDDALTVREALGMKPDQAAPTTRQHERFARWGEQYLREGVAPSPGLSRVFAQLRTWLTQIYQSIKGLGAPINEDIRNVFDRLLAEEPNRTVISPDDLAREPSLPSIHEAEAAEAAPHEAHGIADRIVAERDDYLSRQPPEVQNEIAAAVAQQQEAARVAGGEPAGEAEPGAGGPAAVGSASGASGAEPTGGTSGGERSPQLGGGGEGVPEGAGGSAAAGEPSANAGLRQQRPQSAGATGAHALAPTPATLFGPRESPFVDKAGNIRIENLTSDQDVAQAIRDAAQENNDFIGDRRGVITDGQVLDLADALGMDASKLNQRKLGEAFNAEQVVAARKLLIQSATDVRDIMAKAAAPTATDEDVLAYAHAKARHQMIQGQVAGITAEAGRALRAFRSLAGDAQAVGVDQFLRSATGKTLFQLKEEAKLGAALDTPMKVSKFVRDAQKRTFGSMVLEYWINGLISGPATHSTYMVGNTILSLHKAGPETLTAALIGSAARAMGRKGDVVHFGEAAAKLRGAHLGIPAATQAAFDAFKSGVTTRLPGETPRVLPFQPGSELARSMGINEQAKYSDAMPALYGAVQGIQDGIVSLGAMLKAGGVQGAPMVGLRYSPLGAIPDIAVRGVDVLPLGTVARLPSRAIASIHSFFRTVNYSMEKNALAYRSAVDSGKTGTAFDAHVANLRQNPTPDMMESAVGEATQATLMGKGSEFVQALGKLTNVKILGFPFLKFVDPFVHIAGNIIDQSIVQRTPLGILAPEIRADLMGKNGTIAQDTAAARMLVGTVLSIGFGSLAAQGLMSGSGPSDPREAAIWRLAGNQAHSIRIGDTWYDIHRLGPMGMLGSVAADMYDVAHGASEGDMSKVGASLLQAFTHTMLDEGFGRGPADLIQALTDPQRYGPAYVRNQISSFVPFSVGMGQVARAMDPYSRQARSIMDAIKAKVPGLSETLLPRRDIWGQPLPSSDVFGPAGLSAIYTTQANNDPVNKALLNLGIYPATVDRKIRGVALTDDQFDQYAALAGGMAKQQLDKIVNSPQFSQWPAQTQHDVIEATIGGARETARNMLMARFPSIPAAALRAKQSQLQPDAGE